jgi:hypothetical protein
MPSVSVASIALPLADANHPFFHQSSSLVEGIGEEVLYYVVRAVARASCRIVRVACRHRCCREEMLQAMRESENVYCYATTSRGGPTATSSHQIPEACAPRTYKDLDQPGARQPGMLEPFETTARCQAMPPVPPVPPVPPGIML